MDLSPIFLKDLRIIVGSTEEGVILLAHIDEDCSLAREGTEVITDDDSYKAVAAQDHTRSPDLLRTTNCKNVIICSLLDCCLHRRISNYLNSDSSTAIFNHTCFCDKKVLGSSLSPHWVSFLD